jgi:hypothetical protein
MWMALVQLVRMWLPEKTCSSKKSLHVVKDLPLRELRLDTFAARAVQILFESTDDLNLRTLVCSPYK